jgi:hypothetical protein
MPTTGVGCEVEGHRFVQGWCQVCGEQDPQYVGPPVSTDITTVPTPAPTQAPATVPPSNEPADHGSGDDLVFLLCIIAAVVMISAMGVMLILIAKKKQK